MDKYGFIPTKKPVLLSSYKVAYRIAEEKKPHTIAETLMKPCALEMTEIVCGSEQTRKLEGIPRSNKVVNSRIHDISENIIKQVMQEFASSPFSFSLLLDESTDVFYCSHRVSYVRYIKGDKIKEFLFCGPFLDTAKTSDAFKMVNEFFVKQNLD